MIKLFYLDIKHTENIVNKSIKILNKNRQSKHIKNYRNEYSR